MEGTWLFELISSQGNTLQIHPAEIVHACRMPICPLWSHSRKIMKKQIQKPAFSGFLGLPRVAGCQLSSSRLHWVGWITSSGNMKLLLKSNSTCVPLLMLLETVGWKSSRALLKVLPTDNPRWLQEGGPAALVGSRCQDSSPAASRGPDLSQDGHLSVPLDFCCCLAWPASPHHWVGVLTAETQGEEVLLFRFSL